MQDIRGLRTPFLSVGWNRYIQILHVQPDEINCRQFLMMREFGFVYDSSIAAPVSDPPLWPYTLDYQIPHKCLGQRRCPSRSFPGQHWNLIFLINGITCIFFRYLGDAPESNYNGGIQLCNGRQVINLNIHCEEIMTLFLLFQLSSLLL